MQTATLDHDIRALLDSLPLPPGAMDTVGELIDGLGAAGRKWGVAVGDPAPEFRLPDPTGRIVSLSDALGEGPVVLTFYRGAWCPICNLQIRSLRAHHAAIREAGARLLAVSPQAPDRSAPFVAAEDLEFTVLSDVDQAVIRAYGLQFEPTPAYVKLLQDFGVDLSVENADGSLDMTIPGTFVIGRDGRIAARHVNPNYLRRWETAELVDAVRAVA